MSTDHQVTARTPEPPQNQHQPSPAKIRADLSISKILGGALAAMTAAALGSRLSVAGTVIGAALASVIAAVASAIYTASLKRTQEKVKTVFTARVGGPGAPAGSMPAGSEAQTRVDGVASGWTQVQPAVPAGRPADTGSTRTASRINWKTMVVSALAAFFIAAGLLTAYELVSGHALSGGDGTTITQVSEGGTGTVPTKSKSPSPSASPSKSASPEPSATATSTPAPSEEPTTTPVPVPQPSASETSTAPTPSSTPEPSASASASAATPVPGDGG